MADPATIFLHIAPAKGKAFDAQLTGVWLTPANQSRHHTGIDQGEY